MALTPAQLSTLKAAILADQTLAAYPNTPDGNYAVADLLNVNASPDYYVWRSTVPVEEILDKVAFTNMTPADAPDTSQAWANRSLACQGKQFNLQNLIVGRAMLPTGKQNIRAGLADCLSNYPAGAGGALVSAGWAQVRDGVLKRLATRAEKMFSSTASGNGAQATPADLVFEGRITYVDVEQARNLA